MAITPIDYFYDRQQVRYLEQVVRAFSGFQYMTGRRGDIEPELKMVPCRMAVTNTVVASILNNQSESAALACPMITVFQTGLSFDRENMQNPMHESTVQATERNIEGDQYGHSRGRSYTIRRLMPRPFLMTIQVDIWTSNLDQKYQLLEQILMAIYPDFEIQNSENPLDWTAITLAEPDADLSLTSRTIPIGSSDEIDITTISLKIKMRLSPPALITEQRLIERVITNMTDTAPIPGVIKDTPNISSSMGYIVETLGNYSIAVEGNRIKLLSPKGSAHDDDGNVFEWPALIDQFGVLRPAASQIALMHSPIDEAPIIGTLEYTNDPSVLSWSIDPLTLPANTLANIDGVINPLETFPDQKLPSPATGQRYLLLNNVGPCQAWGDITAKENDIIQYVNDHWEVVFEASTIVSTEFVRNVASNKQLKWDGDQWILSIGGLYPNKNWKLIL